MTKYIRNFYEQGYNVIAPDLRGHEIVKEIMLVWAGMIVKDILVWIQQIVKKDLMLK